MKKDLFLVMAGYMAVLCLLTFTCGPSHASDCYGNKQSYGTYYQGREYSNQYCRSGYYKGGYHGGDEYYPPGHYKPGYYHYPDCHKKDVVIVPKAVAVEVNKDFYFSLADYYRDSLLADAVAARILGRINGKQMPMSPTGMTGAVGGTIGTVPANPTSGLGNAPTAPAVSNRRLVNLPGTDQYPNLWASVQQSCLSCHNNSKADGGISLESADGKMALLPEGAAWKTHSYVRVGLMPKNQEALPDAIVNEWFRYAMEAKGRQ